MWVSCWCNVRVLVPIYFLVRGTEEILIHMWVAYKNKCIIFVPYIYLRKDLRFFLGLNHSFSFSLVTTTACEDGCVNVLVDEVEDMINDVVLVSGEIDGFLPAPWPFLRVVRSIMMSCLNCWIINLHLFTIQSKPIDFFSYIWSLKWIAEVCLFVFTLFCVTDGEPHSHSPHSIDLVPQQHQQIPGPVG